MAERDQRQPDKARVWYRKPWVSTLVVLLSFVVVGAIIVVPVSATDTLSYCASCKATEQAEQSWEQSAHDNVSCTECHVPPGFVAQANWRIEEAKNIWASYLGVDRTPDEGQLPGNDNCLTCHPLEKIPDEKGGVRMSHQVHVELRGLVCADCHDYVSHKKPDQPARVTMQTCPMCHNEQVAPGRCDFCHPEPPKDTHRPDYLKEHGREARLNVQECLRCHHDREQFCDACHESPPANHFSARWRYTHSDDAEKDPEGCDTCHTTDYCAQCHSVQHPADWEDQHGDIAAQGPAACLVCHPQTMCDTCHKERGVTP